MSENRKCRTMPNGQPSVMTFVVVEHDEDEDTDKLFFISMNGWDSFEYEEIDESPEEIQEIWDLTELKAVEVIWTNIKERQLHWF